MKFPYTVLLIALLPFGTVLADVVPIPGTQRVAPVFDAADLVCNCVVESIKIVSEEQLGASPKTLLRQHILADVLIDDRYKGTSSDTRRITVQFDREFPIMRSIPVLQKGERGLMFLKKGDLSVYEFADRLIGVTQFASFPVRDSGLGLPKLQTALASVIHMGSREDAINAMRLLEGFDELSPEAAAAVKPLTSSSDPEISLSAVSVLLKFKAPGIIPQLREYLKTHQMEHIPVALLSVGSELGQGADEDDLPSLEALMSSRIISIKQGAIAGVRRARNPQSAGALIALLDDSDPNVRFLAVITLSEIFSKAGDYAPDMVSFGHNPEFYVGLWKSWWAAQAQAYRRTTDRR